jgi:hypothetical protein
MTAASAWAGGQSPARWAGPVAVAAVMLCGAQLAGQHAVVFPAGVGLAFGVWTVRRPEWCGSAARLVAAPTLGAACGVLAIDTLPSALLAELAALTAAALVLLILPARIGPVLSTAALPAAVDVRSWLYPLTVLAVSALVVGGLALAGHREATREPARRWPPDRLAVVLVVSVCWLGVVAALRMPQIAAAPPLLVSCLEHVLTDVRPRQQARHAALLAAGWTIGAAAALLVRPAALAGTLAVVAVIALVWATHTTHAPVLAMALLPEVTGAPGSWAAVGVGAAVVAGAATALYLLAAAGTRIADVVGKHPAPGHVQGSDSTPPSGDLWSTAEERP